MSDNQGISNVARAHGAMLVYAFLISTSFPVGKVIADQIDPLVITFLRFFLATVVFFVLLVSKEKIVLPRPKDFLRYAIISLSIAIYFVLMFEALKYTTPVKTGAIFTLLPLTTGLIGYILMGIRVSSKQIGALIVGSLGAIWVLFDGDVDALLSLDLGKGELIFALGMVCFAAYSPLIKRLHRGESILALTFWVLFTGTVLMAIVGGEKIVTTQWGQVNWTVLVAVGYLAFFNTAGTFFMVKYSSMILPPAKVMAYTYLTPGIVIAIASVGHELPSYSVLAGIGVTIIAMIMLQRTA